VPNAQTEMITPLLPLVARSLLWVQEDMDRALRDPRLRARPDRFCPVARATCRALGLALRNVRIGGNTISVWGWKGYDYLDIAATKKLDRAVTKFDREQQMQPASFRINLNPSPVEGGRACHHTSRSLCEAASCRK
jgi:hypothetical protein